MRLGVSPDGETIKESKIVSKPDDFGQGVLTLKKITGELSGGEKIEGVAGGIAGVLNHEKTALAKSAHASSWAGKPLKLELEKAFGCQAYLENDTAIEGLGEAAKGTGQGKGIVAFINIGTGIGGVRIVAGKIDKNSLGFEPGHQIIVPEGNLCTCGGKGHWESYVGGSYLEKIYGQKGENITDPQIWDEIAKYLAIGLTNVAVHWSPDIFILGGSVSRSIPLEKVQGYLNRFLTVFPQAPLITKCSLDDDAGLYGALELLR